MQFSPSQVKYRGPLLAGHNFSLWKKGQKLNEKNAVVYIKVKYKDVFVLNDRNVPKDINTWRLLSVMITEYCLTHTSAVRNNQSEFHAHFLDNCTKTQCFKIVENEYSLEGILSTKDIFLASFAKIFRNFLGDFQIFWDFHLIFTSLQSGQTIAAYGAGNLAKNSLCIRCFWHSRRWLPETQSYLETRSSHK